MEDQISPARRTLLKAGAATLATPVAAAIAQPAPAAGHWEAKSFDLWVISDQHVGTDKAASEGILHGMVGFRPPPVRAESLATALRQSEEGGAFGGPPFTWDIALNLGDYAGFWDAPEDEQGREVVRQYSVLKRHRRAGLQYRRQPRRLATWTPRERGQGDQLVVPQMVRPGRGAHRDLGRRSEQASLPDRRYLGALHLQGRQYSLPDDGRPQ